MRRLLISWLLCLPLAFAMVSGPAAAVDGPGADASCPIQHEPSVELLSTLDVPLVPDDMHDDSSGTGCVTSCVNLSAGASPNPGLLPPSSEALHAPVAVWLSTSPERLERPPRV